MVFLSNYLVFKIVLAALGRVDYPVAGDLELKYDTANKIYLSGGSLDYVDDATLYTTIGGETTSYELGLGSIQNKTTTTAYEVVLPSSSGHGTFGINQDATRYVHQYPVTDGYNNGKFQVYSGTPSGGYTEYGSEIQPFDGNEPLFCSMSADGKYILVSTWNGGNDGYKMYKDNGSSYAYHSAYPFIGSHTSCGYTPAFVPSNNNFVITGTDNNTTWYFKLYVYNSSTETWTAKAQVTPSGSSSADGQRGLTGKGFTYDGSYFFQSNNGATTRGEVWSVDWNANTMTKLWHTTEGNNGDGAGGAISPDNRYVVLCRHDGNPYRVYENTSGDWSTVVNVTSDFDLTGSGTSTVFGSYGIGFSGYSSENTTPLYIGQFAGLYGDGKFRLENWSKGSPYQIYITDTGKYSVDATIAGLNYKTNEVEVTGSITPTKSWKANETQILYASDAAASDAFGTSVSVDGDYAIVGAINGNAAYIFYKSGGTWTQQAILTGSDTGSSDEFGGFGGVSIKGDYAVVAARGHNSYAGAAYVFVRSGTNWTQQQKLTTSDTAGNDKLSRCSIDGDYIILGAWGAAGGAHTGAAYIFMRSGTSWTQQQKITASNAGSNDQFGISVAISGDYAIVGAHYEDTGSSNAGAAYIFKRSGTTWTQQVQLQGSSFDNDYNFGYSVSIFGDYAIVGAQYDNSGGSDAGVAFIFKRSGTSWTEQSKLLASDAQASDNFGQTVSINDGIAVVGSLNEDAGGSNAGAAYVFERSGTTWTEVKKIVASDAQADDLFGYSVAVNNNNTVFIGSVNEDTKASNAGAAYIFDKSTLAELKFDNYNKLSIGNAPTNTSSKLFFGSNVYDIGTLTSDLTIETPGLYKGLVFDTSSNVAYFNKTTVGSITEPTITSTHRFTFADGSVTDENNSSISFNSGGSFGATDLRNDGKTSCFISPGSNKTVTIPAITSSWCINFWMFHPYCTWSGNTGGIPSDFSSYVHPFGYNWHSKLTFHMDNGYELQLRSHWNWIMHLYESYSSSSTNSHIKVNSLIASGGGAAINGGNNSNDAFFPEAWHHWAFEYNGTTGDFKFYLDGNHHGATTGNFGTGNDLTGITWGDNSVNNAHTHNGSNTGSPYPNFYISDIIINSAYDINVYNLTKGTYKHFLPIPAQGMSVRQYRGEGNEKSLTSDFISFDTYNKLSLSGLTNPTSKIHALPTGAESTTTYDIGSATNIYIESAGTYRAEMKGSDGFALDSNVVSGTISFPSRTSYRYLALAFSRNTYENSLENMIIEFDDGTKYDNANQPASSAFTQNYAPSTGATTDVFSTSQNNNWNGSSLSWSDGTWYCPFHIDFGSGFTKKVKRVTIINRISDYQYSLIVPRLYGASSVPSTPGLAANWNYVCHVESIQKGWTSTLSSYDTEPTAYRYIGLVGYRTVYSMHIYEFSIELVDGTVYDGSNIPTVSSNMTFGSGSAANTIDGDFTNKANWNSASTYTSASQQYVYLKVDLGSAKKVKHVRVWSNYTGTYTNGPNSMNYYGSSTNTSSVNAEGSSDWNRLGPIELLKSNDTTEQTINSSLYDSKLEFDGYNKLSLNKFDPTSSTLKYGSNTYDLGTITNVYIANAGTYSAEIKGATNFGLSSNITGSFGTYSTLHDNVAISHTTGGGQTLVTVNNIKGNMTYKISFNKQFTDSHGSYSTRLKMYIRDSSDVNIRQLNSIGDYLNNPRDGIFLYDAGGSFDESAMVVGTGFSVYGSAGTHTVGITGGTYGSTRSPFTLADPWYFLLTMSTSDVITGKFFVGDTEVISHFLTRPQSGTSGYSIAETGNKFVFEFHSTATISGVNMTVEEYNPAPKLDFDGYNKLTFSGLDSGSTSNVTFDGNTYSIGTASNVYIENTGTYEAESKGTTTFALTSNVVGTVTSPPTYRYIGFGGMTDLNSGYTTTYNYLLKLTKVDGTPLLHSDINTFTILMDNGNGTNLDFTHIFQDTKDAIAAAASATSTTWHGNGKVEVTALADGTALSDHATNTYIAFYFKLDEPTTIIDGASLTLHRSDKGQWKNAKAFGTNTDPSTFSSPHTPTEWTELTEVTTVDAPLGSYNGGSNPSEPWTSLGATQDFNASAPGIFIQPSLTFDGYKLVVKNITPTSTTLKYGSNTYEIGSATNIYVENTGAYTAEIGGAADFALTSNTVSGTIKTIEPALSGGYFFGHALTYDGKLYGWGENSIGEVGVGTSSDITVPTLCTGIPQGEVVSIWNKDKRSQNQWAKTRDGKIWVTGEGTTYSIPGQTGNQTSFIDVTSYFGNQSLTANNITHISGHGVRTVAALTETGNVWTWGTHNSTNWNLGQGTGASSSNTPKQITFGGVTNNISRFEIGNAHGVALDTDGDVWFWGQIWAGGAGLNYPQATLSNTQKSPHEIMTSNNIIGISTTFFTIYAWQSDGTYYALGQDSAGQIGDGTTTAGGHASWQKVDYFSANNIKINEIYGGAYHVFADTSDGYYCWGDGSLGNFGNGGTTTNSPTKWTNVSNIKVFSSGSYECPYAITEDGKYYAWGKGTNYARGDNTTGDISYPKYINQLPNILAPSFDFDGYDKVFVNKNEGAPSATTITYNAGSWNGSYEYQLDTSQTTDSAIFYELYNIGGSAVDNRHGLEFRKETDGSTKVYAETASNSLHPYTISINSNTPTASVTISGQVGQILKGFNSSTLVFQFTITSDHLWTGKGLKFTKNTIEYDTGKASIITVPDTGTYDAQIKSGTDFSLKSTTVPATSSTGLYTWAFHHGNFDNAYGDGDILTARDNGRFYADTPAYTSASIGTITPGGFGGAISPITQSGTDADGSSWALKWYYDESVTTSNDDGHFYYGESENNGATVASGNNGIKFNYTNNTWHDANNSSRPYNLTYNTSNGLVEYHEQNNNNGNAYFTSPYFDNKSNTTYTFTPPSGGLTANVMMVAGGGGGGSRNAGGGGGAGGLVYTAATSLAQGATKTIVVGNGDSGGYGEVAVVGYDGKDTTFTGLTTADGGGGGGNSSGGVAGGSGGGGGGSGSGGAAASGSQGTAGGSSSSGSYGGGGGGAGAAGSDYSGDYAGDGGTGKFFGTGSSFTDFGDEYGEGGYFAGGGAGGSNGAGGKFGGTPGRGGGGYGGNYYGYMGIQDSEYGGSIHGMVHTGSGGGGSGTPNRDSHTGYNAVGNGGVLGHAGRGGSGIVLIQTNVAPPNGANTAVVQVGNPRRRSLPIANNMFTGSEVNRFYIIDSASMPTYKLPTHWYADPNSSNSTNVPVSQGSHSLQKRADGGTSNVWYQTSSNYFADYGTKMAQSADAVFMPVEQQRYDVLLSIGANGAHDIQLEMAADGTAKLYRNNGATLLQAGTIKCFTVGKWHHISLTVDSEHNAVGYVNGHPVVSTTYTSNPDLGSRSGNMHMRVGVNATFRKFLLYEVSTYNFHMSPKQVLQRAAEVGLGPKLEYDGLNTIKILNTEPGSTVKLFTSNVSDTSNVFIVADPAAGEYTVPEAGKYYTEIKGANTFTITKTIDAGEPLYQYPPVVTGTKSSLTTSLSADTWNTWTMSGASTGNGQYQAKTSHATVAPGGTNATAAGVFTNRVKVEIISDGGASIYPFLQTNQLTNFDITLQLPSAKIIRKYVLYPLDTNAPVSTPGGSVDPTLPGNGSEENKRRAKSWVLKGSSDGTSWTTIDTVSNKPPSIYGDLHTVSSPASYQYYQISISANNGSSQSLSLGEWQLWGDA